MGLGAMLSYVFDGEEDLIIYISHKLSRAKCRYATMEKESLAIK